MTEPEGTFSTGRNLVCDPNLDGPGNGNGNGPDPEDPDFGTFVGQSIFVDETDDSIPKYTIGTADFSIELVVIPRTGDPADGNDAGTLSGLCRLVTGVSAEVFFGVTNAFTGSNALQFFWKGVNVTAANVILTPFRPRTTWTHLCCNYDRSGNMELFDNAVSVNTSDISGDVAESIGELGIYPMVSSSIIAGFADDITDATTDKILPWYSPIAGFAIHSRILTFDEIAANSLALNTGDYPETEARYNFRTFVDGGGTRVVPPRDTDLDHISVFNKWTVPVLYGTELFAPEGANGTLHIEDLSGNAKHFGIQTLSAYTNVDTANRGKASFAITGAVNPP